MFHPSFFKLKKFNHLKRNRKSSLSIQKRNFFKEITNYRKIRQKFNALTPLEQINVYKRWINDFQKKKYFWIIQPFVFPKSTMWNIYSYMIYEKIKLHCSNPRFNGLGLPNNINTWFCLMTLHIWILLVRMRDEENEKVPNFYQQQIVEFYWKDIEDKIMITLDTKNPLIITKYSKKYLEYYHGTLLSLDVGLVEGDSFLAEAVWRNIFNMPDDIPFENLEKLVAYIRREIYSLHTQPFSLIEQGEIKWGIPPFEETEKVPEQIDKTKEIEPLK